MPYPSSVDTGQIQPLALYDGELSAGSAHAGTANQVYYVGVTLNAQITLHEIRVHFGAGGAGHYDVGIYDATGSNAGPGNLLAHAASTATSLVTAAGNLNPTFIGGDIILPPGNYWMALWIDNATDTINSQVAANGSMQAVVTQAGVVGPLPATASSLANGTFKPSLIGLRIGGWL